MPTIRTETRRLRQVIVKIVGKTRKRRRGEGKYDAANEIHANNGHTFSTVRHYDFQKKKKNCNLTLKKRGRFKTGYGGKV